jgi:DNA polymerase-3 subunit beta
LKFTILRDDLLPHIQLASGVVERRQTMPVLSNLRCVLEGDLLTFTGTDQEVEISSSTNNVVNYVSGDITIPARKLVDICRGLPGTAEIAFELQGSRVKISSGRFCSNLSTLAATSFPNVEMEESDSSIIVDTKSLSGLLEKTSFAMAQQDVRYFFNGMLLELEGNTLKAVATNGQRLASSEIVLSTESSVQALKQIIVPRKGVSELVRLLKEDSDGGAADLVLNDQHLQVSVGQSRMTTKLVDAQYPEYQKVLEIGGDKTIVLDRLELKHSLSRIAILSNEVYRNVKLHLRAGAMFLNANNPMQEEAEEFVAIEYNGLDMQIGFNVSYLIDVLSVLRSEKVNITLQDEKSAMLISSDEDVLSKFVVSPMML